MTTFMLPSWYVSGRNLAYSLGFAILLASAAGAGADYKPLTKEEQAKVDKAIDKGIAFLKHSQSKAGQWPERATEQARQITPLLGYTLLPAWALLECGVAADDPHITKVAALLRRDAGLLTWTYDLSLALLFLDRLGDQRDEELIRHLALRIIAGQKYTGGWYYRCPTMSTEVRNALWNTLRALQHRDADVPEVLRILPIFQKQENLFHVKEVPIGAASPQILYDGRTENSNTQFAMLALWAARRHGIPTDRALHLLVRRFEVSQNEDGTWSYLYHYGGRRDNRPDQNTSMTTVGLFALAIGKTLGQSADERVQEKWDEQISRGFAAVHREIGDPTGQMERRLTQPDLYFLYSVERVSWLFKLPAIANKDWYRWGAEILVTNQFRDGSWPVKHKPRIPWEQPCNYGNPVNTSFALLFLKRAHMAKDLTAKLPLKPEELNKSITTRIRLLDKMIGTSSPGEAQRKLSGSIPDKP